MANALASVKGTAFGLDEAATTAASAVAAGVKPGKELEGVLKTVADTATIAGKSMSDTGAIFGSVAARGKLQGDDLMQLQSAGVPVLAMLAKHYGVTAQAASKMVSKGQVDFKNFAAAMHENLGGAALKSGQTFTGAFANLKASLGRIGANLLSGLFPQVKSGIGKLTGILSSVEPIATKVGTVIGQGVAKIGPVLSAAFGAIGPVIDRVKAAFASLSSGGSGAGFMTAIQSIASYVTGSLLPALQAFGSYVMANVVPVLVRLGQIIVSNVVPIIMTLARFLYGTLYPAIVAIVTSIASKLKPIFDQLVATFQARVLPTLALLLGKFREWQPTIQTVIAVVVKVMGAVLGFAAAILGKVLPVVIRFAGFLLANVVGAVVAVIGVVVKVIGSVVSFGVAVVGAVKKAAEFSAGVRAKFGEALTFIKGIPGKVKSALGDLGDLLLGAGKAIIGGLLRGITQKFEDVKHFVGGIGSWIADHKGPIEYDRKLLVPHGQAIMQGLDKGLKSGLPAVTKTAKDVAKKVAEAASTKLKVTKSQADLSRWLDTLMPGLVGSQEKLTATVTAIGKKVQAAFLAAAGSGKAAQTAAIQRALKFTESLSGATARLGKIAADRLKVADALKAAQDRLVAAIAVRDDFAKSVADNLAGWAAITGTSVDDSNPLSSSSIISQMAAKLSSLKDFASNLAGLRAAGLNDTTYAQLVQAGAEQGGQLAAALLQGGGDAVQQVNDLSSQINAQATSLGLTAAQTLYQAGVDAAQGLVNGLKSQESLLLATADRIAAQIVARLRKALKIHSPSRVMAREIGVPMAQGIAAGFSTQVPGLERAVLSAVPMVRTGSATPYTSGGGGMTVQGPLVAVGTVREEADVQMLSRVLAFQLSANGLGA